MKVRCAALLLALLALTLLACGGGGPKKVRTREELEKILAGKDRDQVLEIMGRPDRTYETSDGENWSYDRVARDPVSGKIDSFSTVRFGKDGRVRGVD